MSLTDGLRWTQKCSDITEIFRERRILELDLDNREAKVLYKQAPFIPLTWGCSMELHGAASSCMEILQVLGEPVPLLGLDTDAQSWILFAKFVPHATLLVNGGL